MQSVLFNLPRVYAKPKTGADRTPFYLGELSSFDFDMKTEIKSLPTQQKFPLLQLTGGADLKGSFKASTYSPELIKLCLGAEASSDAGDVIKTLSTSVPATTPFTVTTIGVGDCGVLCGAATYLGTSNMTKVDSVTDAGQYSVSNGVYTFHEDDAGKNIKISYTTTDVKSSKTIVKNAEMGKVTPVELMFYTISENQAQVYKLVNATMGGMSFSWKVGDFGEVSVDFAASADYTSDIALEISSYDLNSVA
jgi:hypothetical protein